MDVHHHHGSPTTILEDREGPATVLIVILVAMLVGFLIWLFGFSGVVFDRGGSTTRIEQTNNSPQDNTNTPPDTNPNPVPS